MATKYSTQYTNINAGVKLGNGDFNGRVKSCFAEFVMAAALTGGDIVKLFKIPAGARVIEAVVLAPANGGNGEVDLGWLANGVDSADANGFIDAIMDTSAELLKSSTQVNTDGLYKVFGAETDVVLTCNTTTDATTGTFKVQLTYVLE